MRSNECEALAAQVARGQKKALATALFGWLDWRTVSAGPERIEPEKKT